MYLQVQYTAVNHEVCVKSVHAKGRAPSFPQVKVESEGTLWSCLCLTLTTSWSPHNRAHLSDTCNTDVASM